MNYKIYNDYELIYMIRENDDFSNHILYEKYKPILISITNHYYSKYKGLGVEYDDFFQEAIIGFQKALFSFDETKNNLFYTFMIVCVHRRLLSLVRMLMSNKSKIFLASCVPLEDINYEDEHKNMDFIFAEKEMEFLMKTIIFDLPWEEGLVLELRINGFRYLEIGELLDFSVKKVGHIIRNIRKIVKKRVQDYYCK
jgi:RNA polymerase sigma factor (sigma-70 family)